MNYKHILLCTLVVPVTFTTYGQESNEQKIQELKDAWYKEAENLELISKEIKKRYGQLTNECQSIHQYINNIGQDCNAKDKKILIQELKKNMDLFIKKLMESTHITLNVKGVILSELAVDPRSYLPANLPIREVNILFDNIKFLILNMHLQGALLQKAIEDYEKCLQKMVELDHKLVLLGHETLYN
jgi:hypothetical protein